jgi:hypothetical protein
MADRGDEEPFCYTCVSSGHWNECEECGGLGFYDGCDIDGIEYEEECAACRVRGGWWDCLGSERHDLDPGSIHRIPLDQRQEAQP